MRVSDKSKQAQLGTNIAKNRNDIASLQNQAATMKRLTKPSDDPSSMAKVLQNRTDIRNLEQFEKNIFFAKSFLDMTESTLSQLGESLIRAKELAIQAANDSNAGMPRELIASEIKELYKSIVEMSNRRVGDRYIFAGFKTTEPPFAVDGTYKGDTGQIQIQNHMGQFMPINLVGSQVFLGEDLVFGEAIQRQLEVPKTVEDLKQQRLLEKSDETDDQVRKLASELNLAEDLLRDQKKSSESEAEMSSAQNTKERKGVNLFTTLNQLEAGLRGNEKVLIQGSLDLLDKALNQINLARAEVGGRVNQLNATNDSIQRNMIDSKSYNSQLEDSDVFKVMTDLNSANQTLEATLKTSAQFSNQSLLDFLR